MVERMDPIVTTRKAGPGLVSKGGVTTAATRGAKPECPARGEKIAVAVRAASHGLYCGDAYRIQCACGGEKATQDPRAPG